MEIQAKLPLIVPLLAVTILTSTTAVPSRVALAFELSASTPLQREKSRENQREDGVPSSADTVTEARWAADYVMGDGGQVAPQHQASEPAGVPESESVELRSDNNHFDSDALSGLPECAPSSATPAEITRLVIEAAHRHDVDAEFAVAVVTAGSRLERLRNSPKGARGPMQLMPATAERFGVTDSCDPEVNIDRGVRYLRQLTDAFHNPLLVAAAYNAGNRRVRERGGMPPFKETLRDVAEVLNVQIGLEGRGVTAGEQRDGSDEPQSNAARGVITSVERRRWVGGVMHF